MNNSLKIVVIIGLALGAILGMLGAILSSEPARAVAWAIDGTGVIVAVTILALYHFRKSHDGVAAGFLVYAIGEAVMLGGTAAALPASIAPFAAGTALWSAGLLLTGIPAVFALWTRLVSIVAAVLFAIVALSIFSGHPLSPVSHPLPLFAYPFLVLTFAGWIWSTVKASD
jgi:hypothetical protein